MNLSQSRHCICHHHGVAVCQEVLPAYAQGRSAGKFVTGCFTSDHDMTNIPYACSHISHSNLGLAKDQAAVAAHKCLEPFLLDVLLNIHCGNIEFPGIVQNPKLLEFVYCQAHLQCVQEPAILHQLWVDIKELGNTYCSSLSDIWILILRSADRPSHSSGCHKLINKNLLLRYRTVQGCKSGPSLFACILILQCLS